MNKLIEDIGLIADLLRARLARSRCCVFCALCVCALVGAVCLCCILARLPWRPNQHLRQACHRFRFRRLPLSSPRSSIRQSRHRPRPLLRHNTNVVHDVGQTEMTETAGYECNAEFVSGRCREAQGGSGEGSLRLQPL